MNNTHYLHDMLNNTHYLMTNTHYIHYVQMTIDRITNYESVDRFL